MLSYLHNGHTTLNYSILKLYLLLDQINIVTEAISFSDMHIRVAVEQFYTADSTNLSKILRVTVKINAIFCIYDEGLKTNLRGRN